MIRHLRHLLSPSKCRTCNPRPPSVAVVRASELFRVSKADVDRLGRRMDAMLGRQAYYDGIRRRAS